MGTQRTKNTGDGDDQQESSSQFEFLNISHLIMLLCAVASAKLMMNLRELETDLALERTLLNVTRNAKYDLVIFNRVPKVGSQTIKSLLWRLQRRNGFTHVVDREDIKASRGELTVIALSEQKRYVDMFHANITPPAAYSKHISYIDFKKDHGQDWEPIYINFVREPVNRIISWYYYIRAPWYQFKANENGTKYVDEKKWGNMYTQWLKTSYEDCVLNPRNKECNYIPGHDHILEREGGSHLSQIMFFCGHKKHCCVVNSEKAFKDAVANVERSFAVVGVLEEMSKSLQVLEHYLPRFFAGVTDEYADRSHFRKTVNKNIYRPTVDDGIKRLVRANLTREAEFYEYCKQRLHRQWLALGLGDASKS